MEDCWRELLKPTRTIILESHEPSGRTALGTRKHYKGSLRWSADTNRESLSLRRQLWQMGVLLSARPNALLIICTDWAFYQFHSPLTSKYMMTGSLTAGKSSYPLPINEHHHCNSLAQVPRPLHSIDLQYILLAHVSASRAISRATQPKEGFSSIPACPVREVCRSWTPVTYPVTPLTYLSGQ